MSALDIQAIQAIQFEPLSGGPLLVDKDTLDMMIEHLMIRQGIPIQQLGVESSLSSTGSKAALAMLDNSIKRAKRMMQFALDVYLDPIYEEGYAAYREYCENLKAANQN